ncbi:unnamed protein product (macronuclear) [Paramecium tetraurelia]|uniref:Protein kinase domain-containing protein n=1 Tax=Paramecium tetraurelia TaxID=5888 RepID=A0BG10_PARTE|nr:uncharacterized protein GSPATT00028512001 [Paramecium tetraurelia]CAK57477.1 unnamed protein product [Paramecium tetraurelia]|eukprot:XP_001424875.1 hypothetical protein (macronuclear) [Paramecium tetraurelia strain d4-2]
MKNYLPSNSFPSLCSDSHLTIYQQQQNPIHVTFTQASSMSKLIKLVGGTKSSQKVRLFDHKCQEIFEEDLKYLKYNGKIFVTTNGKKPDSKYILFEHLPVTLICKGGQATIMLIQHKVTNEEKIIKFISEEQKNQYLYIAREAVILELLKHKNIVNLYGYKLFPEKSEAVLEMEYLKGETLLDFVLQNGPLNEKIARHLFIQILDAVSYMHKNNVIHRDLKLENIIFIDNNNFQIKIIDFGLAYLSGTGVPFDEPLNVGTILYIAPEILSGKLKKINFCLDIWALGILLYYLIFGEYPFYGKNNAEIFIMISQGTYKFPRQVSFELVTLIRELLNPNHENRIKLQDVQKHKWVQGVLQDNLHITIPFSDLETTSKEQRYNEISQGRNYNCENQSRKQEEKFILPLICKQNYEN